MYPKIANTNTMPINVGNGIRATCDSFGIGQTNFLVNVCIMLVTSVDGLRISMKFTSLICVFVYVFVLLRPSRIPVDSSSLSVVYKTNGIRYA